MAAYIGDTDSLIRSGKIMIRRAYLGDYPIFKQPTKILLIPIGRYGIDADTLSEPYKMNSATEAKSLILPESVGGQSAGTQVGTLYVYLTNAMTLFIDGYDSSAADIVITSYEWSREDDDDDTYVNVISNEKHCPLYCNGYYRCEFTWYYVNDSLHTEFTDEIKYLIREISDDINTFPM